MKKTNRRITNNKGFSLVELLIAIAIASIVGAAVFGFMQVGVKTFNYNSSDVNLQSESQLAFNQMQDLIIDTAVGVQYFAKSESGLTLTPVSDDSEIGSSSDKLLRLNNTDKVYDIWWDRDDSKLYYNEWSAHIDTGTGEVVLDSSTPDIVDSALMSEYITGFSVDLSRLISSRVVRVDYTYEKAGRVQASSHNITLRNQVVSGNRIEERIRDAFTVSTNVIPGSVEGKDIIYAEPGETIDLTSEVDLSTADGGTGYTGYHVLDPTGTVEIPTTGPDAKESLRYGFASSSSHKVGLTTIGYTTGSLYIHPTECDSEDDAAGDILVLVYCQSNNSVSKLVTVRVVRTVKIEKIEFTKGSGAVDEITGGGTGDDAFADDLNIGETFKLTATPKISYTKSSVLAEGKKLTAADETKLVRIENDIKAGIKFKGITGYPALFKETGSLNTGINPCEFKMADNFTFESATEKDYYTSDIKVRAICGYSESKGRDVHKDWSGSAYRKKADFTIKLPESDVQRGYDYVTPIMADGSSILGNASFSCKKGDTSSFWTKHCELIEVTATEFDYSNLKDGKPAEREMPIAEYIRSNGSDEGANWTWMCPYMPYSESGNNKIWNPNCEYEFRFTIHIAHAKGNDANKCFVLPRAGYTKADYEYTSNTETKVFERLLITYNKKSDYSNVEISRVVPESALGNRVTYYAHEFGKYDPSGSAKWSKNENKYRANSIVLPMSFTESFTKGYNNYAKIGLVKGHDLPWKAYEPTYANNAISGWSECTSKYTSVKAEGNKQAEFEANKGSYMFRYFKHFTDNASERD